MLSPVLLQLLRDWYRLARPQGWLFPGQNPVTPLSTRQLTRACHAAADMAGIGKRVSPHTTGGSLAMKDFAPATDADDGSITEPVMVPRSLCANMGKHKKKQKTVKVISRVHLDAALQDAVYSTKAILISPLFNIETDAEILRCRVT